MSGPIVALNGVPRCGKGTVAGYLVRTYGFTRHKIAKPIKDMLRALPGITEEHIEGALKELPCPELGGKSPRWGMQTLGKEWKDLMHPDLLLLLWDAGRPPGPVVVDDLRYPNEVGFFRERGAAILRIDRPGIEAPDTGHEAERHRLPVDATLSNSGTIRDLEAATDEVLRGLGVQLQGP